MIYELGLHECSTDTLTIAVSVFGATLGVLGLLYRLRRQVHRWAMVAIVVVAVSAVASLLVHERAECDEFVAARVSNSCTRYSGVVHVLHREHRAGHDQGEQIEVGGHQVSFSHFSGQPGYKQTLAYDGSLGEGACVDLCVYRGRIVRASRSNTCEPEDVLP